jgi:superfamily II helicase
MDDRERSDSISSPQSNARRDCPICDRCNRRVRTGELVRAYATQYDGEGWLWCEECGDTSINRGTEGADEVIVEVVFWNNRLVSVEERDRCLPEIPE